MSAGRILLVEDDRILVMLLTEGLQAEGYSIESVMNGDDAIARGSFPDIDLILLDVTLPGKSGFEVCRELRTRGVETPVLMLTSRDDITDRVQGLKLGADDYLTKPFEVEELIARIEALLRRVRKQVQPSDVFECGNVRVDFRRASVWRNGEALDLSAIELKLLRYFVDHRGEVLTRQELLEKVWGYNATPLTRTVDVHVRLLRQKIEANPSHPEHIVTVHGMGYKFMPSMR